MRRLDRVAALVFVLLIVAACGVSGAGDDPSLARSDAVAASTSSTTQPAATATTAPEATATTSTTSTTTPARPRPEWLGTRVLEAGPRGYAAAQPTPPELVDRRLETPDHLPRPDTDDFVADVAVVPDDVLARSTWTPECPVAREDLRWVRLTFWGFDERTHTGELLVHANAVDAVVAGFAHLHGRRFPIEEMRIVVPAELDAPPTGDGNNTTAFVCRPARGTTSWSEHALGRAVDINPFHNPYVKGDVVLPELATAYVDRSVHRPGMLTADDVAGFTVAGWGWGGRWTSLQDHMHLSATGR